MLPTGEVPLSSLHTSHEHEDGDAAEVGELMSLLGASDRRGGGTAVEWHPKIKGTDCLAPPHGQTEFLAPTQLGEGRQQDREGGAAADSAAVGPLPQPSHDSHSHAAGVAYVAVFLTAESREVLLGLLPPQHVVVRAHHCLLLEAPSVEQVRLGHTPPPLLLCV